MSSRFEALVPDELERDVYKALKAAGVDFNCGCYTYLDDGREKEFVFGFDASSKDTAQEIFDTFQVPEWFEPDSFSYCGQPLTYSQVSGKIYCAKGHRFTPKAVGWLDSLIEDAERRTYYSYGSTDGCPHRTRILSKTLHK